MLFLFRYK